MHNTILNYMVNLRLLISPQRKFSKILSASFLKLYPAIFCCCHWYFLIFEDVHATSQHTLGRFLTVYDKDFTSLLKAHGWQSEGKTVTVAFPFQREDSGWLFEKIKYVIIFFALIYMFCLLKINTLQIK